MRLVTVRSTATRRRALAALSTEPRVFKVPRSAQVVRVDPHDRCACVVAGLPSRLEQLALNCFFVSHFLCGACCGRQASKSYVELAELRLRESFAARAARITNSELYAAEGRLLFKARASRPPRTGITRMIRIVAGAD